ncbi:beta-1,4-N-acetylgalactosaminyltransferase bre-4-like [Mercenaria mercenaria]|uniref:beta-1,4-N-acetylgalactosaminyltransferase bre-4-like n=1 Tax=Mercenaria mercenaria TaxID=6596 RepID=UPI00234E6DFD|nr:beta-1,4-N-acetylgalactosaminyltransferase bre-4-like [Mercenaria mercenaria]
MITITQVTSSTKEIGIIARSTKERNRVTGLVKLERFYNSTRGGARVAVNISVANFEAIENLFAHTVDLGGSYTSKQKIAIVVPYRDREEHRKIFLRHMHPFLQRPEFKIQPSSTTEHRVCHNYTCFVFHDVDLLPEYDRIPYSCANMPQHLSVAVDKFHYRLPYESIFGGACSIRTEHFRKVNGLSNMFFFGWGGEDDDFSKRVELSGLRIVRPSIAVARYKMIKHTEDSNKNPER